MIEYTKYCVFLRKIRNMIKYLERLHEIGIFTLDDVCAMTGNMHSAQQLMQNYVKKGLVGSIRRGLYCVNDLSTKTPVANKFEIGSAIAEDAYISYHSALEYHGFAHQMTFEVQVSTSKRISDFTHNGLDYKIFRSYSNKYVETPLLGKTRVSNLERTVIDCIDNIDRVGGLEELVHCISAISLLNSSKMLDYLDGINKSFLYQKAGFILQYFKENMLLDDDFIKTCKEKGALHPKYLTNDRNESNFYHKDWKLYGPQNLLSYLEQGNYENV